MEAKYPTSKYNQYIVILDFTSGEVRSCQLTDPLQEIYDQTRDCEEIVCVLGFDSDCCHWMVTDDEPHIQPVDPQQISQEEIDEIKATL